MANAIQRGKIKKAPAAEVVKYLIRPAIEADLVRSYNTILDINKAHILMLAKVGIVLAPCISGQSLIPTIHGKETRNETQQKRCHRLKD